MSRQCLECLSIAIIDERGRRIAANTRSHEEMFSPGSRHDHGKCPDCNRVKRSKEMSNRFTGMTAAPAVRVTPEQDVEARRVLAAARNRESLNRFGPRNPTPPKTDTSNPGRQPIDEDNPTEDPTSLEAADDLVSRATNHIEAYNAGDDSMQPYERLSAAADCLAQAAEFHRPKKAVGSQHLAHFGGSGGF
jgi:hypothetical protein